MGSFEDCPAPVLVVGGVDRLADGVAAVGEAVETAVGVGEGEAAGAVGEAVETAVGVGVGGAAGAVTLSVAVA